MRRKIIFKSFISLILVLNLFSGFRANQFSNPRISTDSIEYNGSITFGEYDVGENPFNQLYSFYHNDLLDPSGPPYDPNIIGYGIKQHNSYPFEGNTEIIDQIYGHETVLESHAVDNGYMEGFDIPDSPTSGNQTIEFWWAWENVVSEYWVNTPIFLIQTDNGYIALRMYTYYWYFVAKDNSTSSEIEDFSSEIADESIEPNKFYRYQITLNIDYDIATYTIYGESIVTGTISVPYTIGKIHFISFGTLHSYFYSHWIDSLSWTWDDDYSLGDLLTSQSGEPAIEPKNIWDYWYYFVFGIVGLGGVAIGAVALTKKKSYRDKTPPQDFGDLTQKIKAAQCPKCGNVLPLASYETIEFCPYCGCKFAKK